MSGGWSNRTLLAGSLNISSVAIKQGTAVNHLRVTAIGDRSSLEMDEAEVGEVRDAALKSGQIGMIGGCTTSAGHCEVRQPQSVGDGQPDRLCLEAW